MPVVLKLKTVELLLSLKTIVACAPTALHPVVWDATDPGRAFKHVMKN
jgi:hypothetical protein